MDIQKIKLGNNTYDIKDVVSRTGFATATLVHNITDPNVQNGNLQFSGIVFYGDTAKTVELGKVKLSQLAIPVISSQFIATAGIQSEVYGLENSTAGIVDSSSISIKLVNSKPVIAFNSTTDGTLSGTATEVQLPVGTSGTIALLSDITASDNNKVGHGTLSTTTTAGDTISDLKYYKDVNSSTPLFDIPLDSLQTQVLTANASIHTPVVNPTFRIEFGDTSTDWNRTNTNISVINSGSPSVPYYQFTYGSNNNNQKTVLLPMSANGTIALTSDVGAVQDDVDAIKTLLNVEGTDVQGVIDKYDEIVDFLDGLAETPSLVTQLSEKVYSVNYDETGNAPKITYKKSATGTATDVVTLDTTPTSGSKKPITSGGVYTAINDLDTTAVKKVQVNGKEFSPSSGKVTLPDTVTKIQLNGKDQTLTTTASSGEGKVNLTGIVTKIKFNGTDYTPTTDASTGVGLVTLSETDPVFSASPAHSITSNDITNWNGALDDVQYTTSGTGNNTKHLLQKKDIGGSFASYVELPTARYIDTQEQPETLELILAQAPSA